MFIMIGLTHFCQSQVKIPNSNRYIKYQNAFINGNSFQDQKKFNDAIEQFNIAKGYLLPNQAEELQQLDFLIKLCKLGQNKQEFNKFMKFGEDFKRENKYNQALIYFQKAAELFPNDPSVSVEIKNIKYILNLIEKQGKENSYSEINPKDFNDFVNINYDAMNLLVKNCTDIGKLSYSAVIQFDQQGINQSKLTIHSISDKKFKPFLSSIEPSNIPPSQISNIFIKTKETLNYNLSWGTSKTKAVVRSGNIKINNIEELDYNQKSTIESCISGNFNKSGIYTFNITRKKLNVNSYTDVAFSSFTNNSGPGNFLYSMLLPGLGTSKVTDGKKGKGRMIIFLLSGAIAAGSRIYSLNQYDLYLKDPANGFDYYANADIANKVFLVSGGLAATIYVYDILYVFGRGIKNIRGNRSLKQELSVKPKILVNSPLKP